jgi:hypothetical protein
MAKLLTDPLSGSEGGQLPVFATFFAVLAVFVDAETAAKQRCGLSGATRMSLGRTVVRKN